MTLCAFENPERLHLAKWILFQRGVKENSEGVGKWPILGVAVVGKFGIPLENW